MKAPQIIYIVLIALNLYVSAQKHGQPKNDNYNFWQTLLALIIQVSLLIWGGFFEA